MLTPVRKVLLTIAVAVLVAFGVFALLRLDVAQQTIPLDRCSASADDSPEIARITVAACELGLRDQGKSVGDPTKAADAARDELQLFALISAGALAVLMVAFALSGQHKPDDTQRDAVPAVSRHTIDKTPTHDVSIEPKRAVPTSDTRQRLAELVSLHSDGLLTDSELATKRAQILESL